MPFPYYKACLRHLVLPYPIYNDLSSLSSLPQSTLFSQYLPQIHLVSQPSSNLPSPITPSTENNHNTSSLSSIYPYPSSPSYSYTCGTHTAISFPDTGPCPPRNSGTIVYRSARNVLLRFGRSGSRCKRCCV